MQCPRCKLENPSTASRCDCGYDFETKTVQTSYAPQAMPKAIKTSLVVLVVANVVLGLVALSNGDPARIFGVIVWSVAVWMLYFMLVKRSNGARIALAVLTFPVGTMLFLSAEARLYCLQTANPQ
jgi:hypothetical protein